MAISETGDDRFDIDVASSKILTLSGVISGGSGGEITKTGAGTLVMSNTGNSHDKKVADQARHAEHRRLAESGRGTGRSLCEQAHAERRHAEGDRLLCDQHQLQYGLGVEQRVHRYRGLHADLSAPPISGSGAFGKTGAGTLLLTGTSTFTGPMTNSVGTVQIGNNGTAGSLTANIVNNATLVWHRSDDSSYSGAISGTGTLTKNGAGILTLGGNSSYSGVSTISDGAITLTHANGLGTIGRQHDGGRRERPAAERRRHGGTADPEWHGPVQRRCAAEPERRTTRHRAPSRWAAPRGSIQMPAR